MSSIYSIFLQSENEEMLGKILEKIKELYPERYYKAHSTFILLSIDGISTTSQILDGLRIFMDSEDCPGIIISEVVTINGYYFPELWEWKRKLS